MIRPFLILWLLALPLLAQTEEPSPTPPSEPSAAPADTLSIGTFSESGTNRYDYFFEYALYKTQVAGQPLRLEVDHLTNTPGLMRFWLNYGQLTVADGEDFKLNLQPGVIIFNNGSSFYGGHMNLAVPAIGLTVTQMSYFGNRNNRNQTFSNLQLSENFSLFHYLYMQTGYTPDSYVGPALTFGDLFIWAGPSVVRPGALSTNVQYTIRF